MTQFQPSHGPTLPGYIANEHDNQCRRSSELAKGLVRPGERCDTSFRLLNEQVRFHTSVPLITDDHSKNNAWVAALTFGEGRPNNNHVFPHSARHGFGRQIDLTWQHIRLMRRLGLATQVRLPAPVPVETRGRG